MMRYFFNINQEWPTSNGLSRLQEIATAGNIVPAYDTIFFIYHKAQNLSNPNKAQNLYEFKIFD